MKHKLLTVISAFALTAGVASAAPATTSTSTTAAAQFVADTVARFQTFNTPEGRTSLAAAISAALNLNTTFTAPEVSRDSEGRRTEVNTSVRSDVQVKEQVDGQAQEKNDSSESDD